MLKIILISIMLNHGIALAQLPDEYDLKQDERFYKYIEADSVLAREVVKDIAGIKQGVNYMTGMLAAIGLMFLGVIGAWLRKRLQL